MQPTGPQSQQGTVYAMGGRPHHPHARSTYLLYRFVKASDIVWSLHALTFVDAYLCKVVSNFRHWPIRSKRCQLLCEPLSPDIATVES